MTRREFMEMLRLALNGKVTSAQLADNLQFYEDYINTEIRKGRSEADVLAQLGDPRLIARTIVETGGGSGNSGYSGEYEGENRTWYESGEDSSYPYGEPDEPRSVRSFRVPIWAWLALGMVVVVLVLSAVFSVIAALLPVILPILIVLLLVKAFRDWFS